MTKGQIRVQTENIFPIIKKFLYSDHEIFLRELIANAVDASQKIKTFAAIGDAKGELGEVRIDITLDATNKTLTIKREVHFVYIKIKSSGKFSLRQLISSESKYSFT